MTLKLYSHDFGWEGAILAVAETREEALNILRAKFPHIMEDDWKHKIIPNIKETEIIDGAIIEFEGET